MENLNISGDLLNVITKIIILFTLQNEIIKNDTICAIINNFFFLYHIENP